MLYFFVDGENMKKLLNGIARVLCAMAVCVIAGCSYAGDGGNNNPPPVLPAQAPVNIRKRSSAFEKLGHKLKSETAKPVVVIILDTWKAASCIASLTDGYIPEIFIVIRTILPKAIPR